VNVWERIKRLWATPAPPDRPLTADERELMPPHNMYDEVAHTEGDFASHGDPDVRGKLK
jgi:hypothetical protein